MDRTESKSDTSLTRGCSGDVRYELVDKDGQIVAVSSRESTFSSAENAANYAKLLWPGQEQDPDRTGAGWDIQVVGS